MSFKNIKWSIPNKKSISDRHNIGDIIFVKKKNVWKLKQYPKVNGGISFRSFTGDVKALVGDLILNQVNLIELLKQKDNLAQHLSL